MHTLSLLIAAILLLLKITANKFGYRLVSIDTWAANEDDENEFHFQHQGISNVVKLKNNGNHQVLLTGYKWVPICKTKRLDFERNVTQRKRLYVRYQKNAKKTRVIEIAFDYCPTS